MQTISGESSKGHTIRWITTHEAKPRLQLPFRKGIQLSSHSDSKIVIIDLSEAHLWVNLSCPSPCPDAEADAEAIAINFFFMSFFRIL